MSIFSRRLCHILAISFLLYLCSASAFAQLIPAGFQESIDNLTLAIRDLKDVLKTTGQSTDKLSDNVKKLYNLADEKVPDIEKDLRRTADALDNLTSAGTSIKQLSSSLSQLYSLAEERSPDFQNGLEKSANALTDIAGFGHKVEDNTGRIIGATIGALACGIVVGVMLANHVFILEKEKNVFAKIFRGGHTLYVKWRRPGPVTSLELSNSL